MMTLGELATLMVAKAKAFRNAILIPTIVPTLTGQDITEDVVRAIVGPFVEDVSHDLPEDVASMISKRFEEFVPDAMQSVLRNRHMNDADETNLVNVDNADALLVAFVNEACVPLDLALYTRDLREQAASEEEVSTLDRLTAMFVGRLVRISHTANGRGWETKVGICKSINGTDGSSFNITLEKQHSFGFTVEVLTENSSDGPFRAGESIRRKIEVVSSEADPDILRSTIQEWSAGAGAEPAVLAVVGQLRGLLEGNATVEEASARLESISEVALKIRASLLKAKIDQA